MNSDFPPKSEGAHYAGTNFDEPVGGCHGGGRYSESVAGDAQLQDARIQGEAGRGCGARGQMQPAMGAGAERSGD